MRTELIERTYANFQELSKERQLKELDKYRDILTDYGWHENISEDYKNILEMIGFYDITIYFSGFSSQGDGACFMGEFTIPNSMKEFRDKIKLIKSHAPKDKILINACNSLLNAKLLKELKSEYQTTIEIQQRGNYCHEMTMCCYYAEFLDAARDIARNIYRTLESEYNYLTSDEAIIEYFNDNETEFLIKEVELL